MSMEKREGRCVGSNTRNALVVIVIIASAPGRRKAALLIVVLVVAGRLRTALTINRILWVASQIAKVHYTTITALWWTATVLLTTLFSRTGSLLCTASLPKSTTQNTIAEERSSDQPETPTAEDSLAPPTTVVVPPSPTVSERGAQGPE
nr:hypothetical protein CFP56_44272 [Quercus suber]